ncbi:MAG: preprotein translocase subunit SecG [Clostridia bacterium]|nr:preprotein translocase subunit SecG [Clostridiales bacterium]
MTALKVVLGIFYMLICLIVIIIILMQESKSDGLSSVITGENTESFYNKNKGLSKDRFLSKLTVVLSIFFAVVAIVLSVLMRMG